MLQVERNGTEQAAWKLPAHCTKQGNANGSSTCYLQQADPATIFTRLKARKIALTPACAASAAMSYNIPPLHSGDSSQDTLLRAQLFIQSLKDQADYLGISVTEFISGAEGQSVLKRLYAHDKLLALSLIKTRLEHYSTAYDDPDMMTPWDDEGGTQQQQDIAELQEINNSLLTNSDDNLFGRLLHLLSIFEQGENRIPFEDCYNLALLKTTNIASPPELNAVVPKDKMDQFSRLLDPADLTMTNRGLIAQKSAEQIKEAVQEICIEEGQKQQKSFLQQHITWLFKEGQLDPEHFTAAENLEHLCETSPEQAWVIFNEYYTEAKRKDSHTPDGLMEYEYVENKSVFLKTLMETDDGLKAWIQGPLMHQLLSLSEQQLLVQMKSPNKTTTDNQIWLGRLTSFARRAKTAGYAIHDKVQKKLEVLQVVAMQSHINKGKTGDPSLWALDGTMTIKQIREYLASDDSKGMAGCVKALQHYLWLSSGIDSIETHKEMLKAKDTLLKAQIEHLFALARTHIDSEDILKRSPKTDFEYYLQRIMELEALRPPVSLLSEKFTLSGIATAVGCHLIRGAEVPVHQRMRDIFLEYQLKHHFNYNFTTEMSSQISAIPGQVCATAGAVVGQVKELAGFIGKTVSGKICLSEACKKSFAIQQGTSNALLDTLRQQLEDYAELCKHHPHMARVLAGNVAQTLAVIENSVSKNSELYNIFNQFKKRISMEAMASYMTEQFNPAEMDISTLDPQKAEALKRMFALCQFFQWAPEAVTGAAGTMEIMTNAASGSVLGTAWSTFKTVFKVFSATVVKQGVSTLSDEDVRGINMAIMTMEHGPKEAARRLQAMQTTAEFIADQAKGFSVKYSAIKAVMRPFTVRFTRLADSFKQWKTGKGSMLSLLSETIKATAVVAPVIASAVATPMVSSIIGPAFIGYTIISGPALSLSLSLLFYQTDPFKDMALLVNKKVNAMLDRGMEGIVQRAKNETRSHLQQGGYSMLKKQIAYEKLHTRFWADFQHKHQYLAKALENKFEQDAATDPEYLSQLEEAQSMAREFRQLDQILQGNVKRQAILSCLPDAIKAQVPADNAQAIYWAIARVQLIRETLLQRLGTAAIPGDDEAVAKRFFQFRKKLTCVEFMRQHEAKVGQCLPAMINEAETTVQKSVESLHKKAYLLSGKVAIHQAITNMVGDASLSKDKLDRMLNRREHFSQRIDDQLKAMKHIYANA